MEDHTVREFKYLVGGGVLMVTGAELYQITGTVAAFGFLFMLLGGLMFLGGLFGDADVVAREW